MSQKDRSFDPYGPSTSGGRKKPYSRPESRSESEYSVKAAIKSSSQESGISYSQHPTEKVQIKSEEGDVSIQETRGRRKMETIFVTRPNTLVTKKGRSGRPVMLQSNHFKVPTVPNWCLYKYRVDFEPEETRTFVRKGLLKLHKDKVGAYIFDGTVLYTSCRISDKVELVSTRKSDDLPIKIIIRLVGDMMRDDPHYIQFFNIIMRKCLEHLKLQLVGRNYYDAKHKIGIPQFRLELWPGYITSIRQYENNVLMCAEITHKVMRTETLLDMLRDCYTRGGDYRNQFCNNVIGIMVLTGYNNNTYRIEDVDFDTNPSSTFSKKSGEKITYQEYYKSRYQIKITDVTQPMLVTRTKPKSRTAGQGDLVYLVPELCRPTGLTDNMRENFHLMKELARYTRVTAAGRVKELMNFNNTLRHNTNVIDELNSWNLQLERNLLEVPGRILPSERLVFADNNRISCTNGDWTRPMQNARLYQSKQLRSWVLIINQRDSRSLQQFLSNLHRASYGISFQIMEPKIHYLRDDKSSAYVEALNRILEQDTPDLVLCVVSNNRSDRYTAIKKKLCIDRPVPSQVILQKNLDGRNALTIATKVAIQMNCKLGGAPWHIECPLRGLMTIGFDICHDSGAKGREFLGMVATVDQTLTRYFSSITLYHSNEELAEQLCAGVCKAVQAYRAHNRALPMYLVIYRDGVSDGQIPYVYEHEVSSLKKKLEELYYGPNFKLTFIIVSKRINIRLFNNGYNPSIGTIVDDVITSPFKYDFFLVSQNIRQGTISPTSYNIIFDNSGLDPDMIQTVTYKLTHMYYNSSSTIRVPAPCHYAQKLSFLVGRILHQPPSTQLENKLFFL